MTDKKRLIEADFPLERVSLDSVHEKNVRHGHISTLHVWPARRPLAACRAAMIATLLPDPENAEERDAIYRRLAGEVIEKVQRKKINGRLVEVRKKETKGGILHWGRESGPDLDWFRKKIRESYDGRAPKVLDPFAGGGAIPLEAMRLGCETLAVDINPVAWFILKCTLEYPQRLAGKTLPLPEFAREDGEFMEAFLKAKGFKGKPLERQLAKLGLRKERDGVSEPALIEFDPVLEADLAWQVRAWGRWVLANAQKRLAHRYPTYAELEALKPGGPAYEPQPMQLLEPDADGKTDASPLNTSYSQMYLNDPRNPRWVKKPTVAYLWARTVRCKGCRAIIPLLKTKWLAKKDNKRVLLTLTPNSDRTGATFGIEKDAPLVGGNAAQRREHDRRIGAATMTQSGAQCLCCPAITRGEDIRFEGLAGRLGTQLVCVVVDGLRGKEYRLPSATEFAAPDIGASEIANAFSAVTLGDLYEPISANRPSPNTRGASGLPRFGISSWDKVFTNRQRLSLASILVEIRRLRSTAVFEEGDWAEAIFAFLCCAFDRTLDFNSQLCTWIIGVEAVRNTFVRYVLPLSNDFMEVAVINDVRGGFSMCVDKVGMSIETIARACRSDNTLPTVLASSAKAVRPDMEFDLICTDPPYYDAIPYSDIMDYFYVWLRRLQLGYDADVDSMFREETNPKWDHAVNDGELIDDVSRFAGNATLSRTTYETGMGDVFANCNAALKQDGRLVIVFANKQPVAWETLVAALIRSGFVVDASWPIMTEQAARMQALSGAALASSVWLVCKKRPVRQAGWDTAVLSEMRNRIHAQLRAFWDAGIRGPDFVWAATGPALEAYSKYPAVRKANEPDALLSVAEFLKEVRRIVVDFVVGRVFDKDGMGEASAESLDDVTTYYLLHRHDFGLDDAPVGACILYALSCNLLDTDLADRYDILSRSNGALFDGIEESDDDLIDEDSGDDANPGDEGSSVSKGNKVHLKDWKQRKGKSLGYEAQGGKPVPIIDQAHRLMHLWRAGDEAKVEDYLDARGLKRNELFRKVLQALIELSAEASEERSILESISNHISARAGIAAPRQRAMEL